MSPEPPSSSDGSPLPPRHRPNMGNLAKDTTESDLWAFDDLEGADEKSAPAQPAEPVVPAPRQIEKLKVNPLKDKPAPKGTVNPDRIKMNITKVRAKGQSSVSQMGTSKADSDFDDLDHWEDDAPATPVAKTPEEKAPEPPAKSPEPATPAAVQISTPSAPPQAAPANDADEFSPVVKENAVPISLRPQLSLTKVERIGLIALLLLLLTGGIGIVIFSLNRLPTESAGAKANDFPIKGKSTSIVSATTYWRAPQLTGKNADTVRRGTAFIPAIHLTTGEGNAAIRVFFHNDENQLIGDAVTRVVRSGETLEVGATAGFEDDGMFAAYRTGQSKPWTVEVFEGPSVNSPNPDFKKLFEMSVSADLKSASK